MHSVRNIILLAPCRRELGSFHYDHALASNYGRCRIVPLSTRASGQWVTCPPKIPRDLFISGPEPVGPAASGSTPLGQSGHT